MLTLYIEIGYFVKVTPIKMSYMIGNVVVLDARLPVEVEPQPIAVCRRLLGGAAPPRFLMCVTTCPE